MTGAIWKPPAYRYFLPALAIEKNMKSNGTKESI
jgi:hypothetical protein